MHKNNYKEKSDESLLEKEKNYQNVKEEIEEHLKDELKWLYKFGKDNGVEKEDIDNIICSYIEQRR